jgi:hypothetical protein
VASVYNFAFKVLFMKAQVDASPIQSGMVLSQHGSHASDEPLSLSGFSGLAAILDLRSRQRLSIFRRCLVPKAVIPNNLKSGVNR